MWQQPNPRSSPCLTQHTESKMVQWFSAQYVNQKRQQFTNLRHCTFLPHPSWVLLFSNWFQNQNLRNQRPSNYDDPVLSHSNNVTVWVIFIFIAMVKFLQKRIEKPVMFWNNQSFALRKLSVLWRFRVVFVNALLVLPQLFCHQSYVMVTFSGNSVEYPLFISIRKGQWW